MNTNLTNINVVGSPDYYLELESGKPYGYVELTRDSTATEIQLQNCRVSYKFKLTRGNLTYDSIQFYEILSDDSQRLTVFKESSRLIFRLSNGPDFTDIAIIELNTDGSSLLVLNNWYDLIFTYNGGHYAISLIDVDTGDSMFKYIFSAQSLYFNVASWGLNFDASPYMGAIVGRDSEITIKATSETVLDLYGIEWDPVPSIESFGTTNAI